MTWWDQHYRAGCEGKTVYATPQAAHAVLSQMAKHRYRQDHRHVYQCRHCHNWHIGGRHSMKGDPVALEKPQPRQRTLRVQLPEPLYDWLMAQHRQLGISVEALMVDIITAYRLEDVLNQCIAAQKENA